MSFLNYATDDDRAERIANLRALADFLESMPSVPLPRYTFDLSLSVGAGDEDDAENIAEIARLAVLFGVEPTQNEDGTHHRAALRIGHLTYTASTVTRAAMDRHTTVRRLGEAALAAVEQEAAA